MAPLDGGGGGGDPRQHPSAGARFQISPAHFVERNGLLLIVALGESIVAVGLGARGLPITPSLVLTAVLALLLSAAIWWTYFDRDDRRAEHQFAAATAADRARMALLGFGYAHFVMIAGIILIAAGLEVGIAHPLGHAEAIGLWNLAAGLALYLVGDTLYRRVLRIGPGRLRLAIAALIFLTVPLGLAFGALAQVAACVLLLQPLWIVDRKGGGGPPR
ncbi:MAG TPA: low temperature requirement protein A [Thermomicrobiales bacterium]